MISMSSAHRTMPRLLRVGAFNLRHLWILLALLFIGVWALIGW